MSDFFLDDMESLRDRARLDRDDSRQAADAQDDRRALRSALVANVPASAVRSLGSK